MQRSYRLRHRGNEAELFFGYENKMADTSLASRVKTTAGTRRNNSKKNIAKTARRQLGGRHLLFGDYLLSWTNLNVNYRK